MAISRDDLVAFHKAHFLPNNASLAVVGDVKAEAILPLIEKAFGAWERGEVLKADLPALPKADGINVHLVDRPGSVQSNIIVTQQGPARNGPDLPELNVLTATLGGGFSGRLFQNLRERHGWTYGSSSYFDYRKHAGSFEATAETRNEVTAPAIGEILKEIERIRQEPIPEPELELQRQYNVGNYLLSLENANRTATRVQDIDLYGLEPDFYKTYAKRMDTVTAEQAKTLANKYLDPENISVIVVGEAKEVKPSLEKIGKVSVYDTELRPIE
jgi:zinc protease